VKTWNVILATLVIFVAGIITGAGLVMFAGARHNHPRRLPAPPAPEAVAAPATNAPARLVLPFGISAKRPTPKDFLSRLDSELKLTPDQYAQIEKILTDGQQRAAQLWQTIAPQIRDDMKSAREQIRQTLKPEQRARFEELMKFRPSKPAENPPAAGAASNAPAAPPQ
jgi:Spy/CpxP family protein refolding chaperone